MNTSENFGIERQPSRCEVTPALHPVGAAEDKADKRVLIVSGGSEWIRTELRIQNVIKTLRLQRKIN